MGDYNFYVQTYIYPDDTLKATIKKQRLTVQINLKTLKT